MILWSASSYGGSRVDYIIHGPLYQASFHGLACKSAFASSYSSSRGHCSILLTYSAHGSFCCYNQVTVHPHVTAHTQVTVHTIDILNSRLILLILRPPLILFILFTLLIHSTHTHILLFSILPSKILGPE